MKILLKLAAVSLLASACTALQSGGKVEDDYYSSNIDRFMQKVAVKKRPPVLSLTNIKTSALTKFRRWLRAIVPNTVKKGFFARKHNLSQSSAPGDF